VDGQVRSEDAELELLTPLIPRLRPGFPMVSRVLGVVHASSTVSAFNMKVTVKQWHAVAYWRWDTGSTTEPGPNEDDDSEDDVCGICRVSFEGCCPTCKMPGDDCPLIWGECTHVFHMHCLLKWLNTASSKQQCPMDRRPWITAERKVDR